MVYEILSATTFGREKKGEVMILVILVFSLENGSIFGNFVSEGWYQQTS